MDILGQNEIWSFIDSKREIQKITTPTEVTSSCGHAVESYLDLAKKVAELQFRNRDHVLLFRGQPREYTNTKGNTSLKPSIFRPEKHPSGSPLPPNTKPPDAAILNARFKILGDAARKLVRKFPASNFHEETRLKRQRILQWAVLQHYEVCDTPLLDVTHSLRIAASFASLGTGGNAFIYVLAVPNLSGSVTASAEAGLQILRLSSICPPTAVRPHIQEGYLLGEYPDIVNFDQKSCYPHHEIDFGRRLIAKFKFDPKKFWKRDAFPAVTELALYPNADQDPFQKIAASIKASIKA